MALAAVMFRSRHCGRNMRRDGGALYRCKDASSVPLLTNNLSALAALPLVTRHPSDPSCGNAPLASLRSHQATQEQCDVSSRIRVERAVRDDQSLFARCMAPHETP